MTNPPNDSKVRGFLLRFIAMAQEDADARMLTRYGEQQIDNFINQAVIADLLALLPERKLIDIEIPDTLHRNIGFNQAIDQMETAIKNYCRRDG